MSAKNVDCFMIRLRGEFLKLRLQTYITDAVTCIFIYTKFFSIMGLSWIFGFISVKTEVSWVTYGLIVVNSLQPLVFFSPSA